jgi:hypothetical protein
VSHELRRDLRGRRLEICGWLLPTLEERARFIWNIGQRGRQLVCVKVPKWSVVRDEVSTNVNQVIDTKKVILAVIWGIDEFLVVDMMPLSGRFNTEFFHTNVMDPLLTKVFPDGRKSHTLPLRVHLDNSWVHSSNASMQF